MINIFYALLCSIMWAAVTIATKLLAGAIPSFAFSFLRYGIATLTLIPFLFMRTEHERIKIPDLPTILFLGFTLVFLFNALFFTALYYSSANSVALIGATNPIITMIASALIFHHIPSRYQILAFMLSFIGVSLVITQGNLGWGIIKGSIGELSMLAGVGCQVMYAVALSKIRSHYSSLFLSVATGISGSLFVLPFIANKEFLSVIVGLTAFQWALLLFIGCLGTALGIVLYSDAIKYMGPAKTSLTIFSTMPIFVFILAFLILGEKITQWQIIGGLLVISSLLIGLRHTR